MGPIQTLDAVIFGGGSAGLWLLDLLSRQGSHAVLLESRALGSGQTIASQGIIHGGMKYSLQGLVTRSARQIAEMPDLWRDALLGARMPNLTHTRVRAGCCYLWQTTSLASRVGMLGARIGLRVKPELVPPDERPAALQGVPGLVARMNEQVISPRSFIADLAEQYQDRILKIDAEHGVSFQIHSPGEVQSIVLTAPDDSGRSLTLAPKQVIFTAGAGNGRLRQSVGLNDSAMQRRPLHMVVGRGPLPELNGHCIDGAHTRVTITSDLDPQGRTVWQVGGQVAEDGVLLQPDDLIEHTLRELRSVLPALSLDGTEWSTYRVDRAEGATNDHSRPESIQLLCAGNVTTGWPTKLALAPVLAQQIASRVSAPVIPHPLETRWFHDWPRPGVALTPWEEEGREWRRVTTSAGARAA